MKKPTVSIDLYKAKLPNSGLGQFSINFHNALCSANTEGLSLKFLIPANFENQIEGFSYKRLNIQNRYFPFLGKKSELWHSLHQFPSHLPPPSVKQILTIHDLNFLKEKKESKAMLYLKKLQANVDRADYLTVISDYTENEVRKYLNTGEKPVFKIYNGVKILSEEQAVKPKIKFNKPFYFSIGLFSHKKNFHTLLELMTQLPNEKLIIAGKNNTSYGDIIREGIAKLNLQDRVYLSGEISEEEKAWYYYNCKALFFPSIAEGFGMPVIEAMMAGKPLFLSREGSLPEIGGQYAFYWDNFNAKNMAETVQENLKFFVENEKINKEKIKNYAAKYNWHSAIEEYLKIYNTVLENIENKKSR